MPVNEEGVEVNEDGSEITPEQLETSDWTNVLKLQDKANATALSIEVLAPSTVPHNIPYLEVYRTDEVFFKEYTSPFLSNSGNTTFEEPTESLGTDSLSEESQAGDVLARNVGNQVNNGSSKGETHSSKTKTQKLASELESVLRKHYKSGTNFKVLVQRYTNAKKNKLSIGAVTVRSANNLKKGTNVKTLTNSVLRIKQKYG